MFGCNSTWLAYLLFGVGAPFFILQGDDMDTEEVIKVLKVERECVRRASTAGCNRDCENCDLLMDAKDIITAYNVAISMLKREV